MVAEVKAKYDYNSGHEDDLSFTAGQIINIIEEVDEEWFNGAYVDGQGKRHQGMFPRNFVIATTSHSTVAAPVSAVKQSATKETPIKSKVVEFAGRPNVSGKQSPPVMPSTSVRSAISPPSASTPLKSDSRTPVRGTQTLHQPEEGSPQLGTSEKPSSFRDRIAAFNKATDAPLAPRALPKPTSFVRKPFIPPPPSKESYYALSKPTPPSKPASQVLPPEYREATEESSKHVEDETSAEPDMTKESMKDKILAIQKGLDYSIRPPAPLPRRAETYGSEGALKYSAPEHVTDPITMETLEPQLESVPKETLEEMEEKEDVPEDNRTRTTMEMEDVDNLSKSEVDDEPEAPELDPEVARRIAIRERMAKMSGGMGMHMGMGMGPPPAFSRNKSVPKPPSSPPSSPPVEHRDPIPIIPGLPSLKTKEPTEVSHTALSPVESEAGISEMRSPSDRSPDVREVKRYVLEQARAIPPTYESTTSDVGRDDIQGSSDEGESVRDGQEQVEIRQQDLPEETSDGDDCPDSPKPTVSGESRKSLAAILHPADRQPLPELPDGLSPPVPVPRSYSMETVPRTGRPPPPPPPISTVSYPSPPPVPLPFKTQLLPPLVPPSKEPKYDDTDEDHSSVGSEEPAASDSPYDSPKSPQSRPHPPPLPPSSLPPRSPATSFSKAPPIPATPRNFDLEHGLGENYLSHHAAPAPAPVPPPFEHYRSTSIHDDPRSPFPPPSSPTSTPFRRTQSERPSLESSRGRSSMEPQHRDGSYISMKEENIHDGRWWLDATSPPLPFRNRGDLIFEVEDSTSTRRGGHTSITREVYILFSDYSQTIVTAQYDRDEPSRATLSQRHLPPPAPPTKSQLEARHDQVGHQIVALAKSRLGSSVGDGSSIAFIQEIFGKLENCLPSAGARSHGALVYSNIGNSSTRQFDEIRPGDVVAFRNSIFQAHAGIRGKIVTEVGKPDHVAVITEWNGIKKKLKVLEQRQDSKRVAHSSYKIGDLKSGEVHVFRPMPRSWVDW